MIIETTATFGLEEAELVTCGWVEAQRLGFGMDGTDHNLFRRLGELQPIGLADLAGAEATMVAALDTISLTTGPDKAVWPGGAADSRRLLTAALDVIREALLAIERVAA